MNLEKNIQNAINLLSSLMREIRCWCYEVLEQLSINHLKTTVLRYEIRIDSEDLFSGF